MPCRVTVTVRRRCHGAAARHDHRDRDRHGDGSRCGPGTGQAESVCTCPVQMGSDSDDWQTAASDGLEDSDSASLAYDESEAPATSTDSACDRPAGRANTLGEQASSILRLRDLGLGRDADCRFRPPGLSLLDGVSHGSGRHGLVQVSPL